MNTIQCQYQKEPLGDAPIVGIEGSVTASVSIS